MMQDDLLPLGQSPMVEDALEGNPSSISGDPASSEAVEEIAAPAFNAPPPDQAIVEVQAALMSEQDFTEFLASLFPATAYGIALVYPPPLQSLVHAPSVPEFRPAADALYRMAQRYPWLRWLLDPESVWMKDLFIIGAFGGKVGYAVYGEIRARQQDQNGFDRLKPQPTPGSDASQGA